MRKSKEKAGQHGCQNDQRDQWTLKKGGEVRSPENFREKSNTKGTPSKSKTRKGKVIERREGDRASRRRKAYKIPETGNGTLRDPKVA